MAAMVSHGAAGRSLLYSAVLTASGGNGPQCEGSRGGTAYSGVVSVVSAQLCDDANGTFRAISGFCGTVRVSVRAAALRRVDQSVVDQPHHRRVPAGAAAEG